MVLSIKKKFVWFHIPKTAGTSIRTVLSQYGVENDYNKSYGNFFRHYNTIYHPNQLWFNKTYGDSGLSLKKYFEFVVVRHPYDRLVSVFHYSSIGKKIGDLDMFLYYIEAEHERARYNPDINYILNYWLQPQTTWTTNPLTTKLHVFKFENLNNDWEEICYKINIDYVPLQNLNQQRTKLGERIVLTKAQKDTYYNIAKDDFELFGYDR